MPYAALGGCLAVVLIITAVLAQEKAQQPSTPVDKGQGVSIKAPSPKDEATKTTGKKQQPPDTAPNITIILEDKRPTEPPCGPRCQAAEQNQKDDLKAQQSMAWAAISMTNAVWAQFGLGIIGIILLAVTARYAYRAAKAAENAVKEAREATRAATRGVQAAEATTQIAERQLQTYVSQDEPEWKRLLNPKTDEHIGYALMIMWRNVGATPASRCRTRVAYAIFPNGFTSDFDYPEGDVDKQPKPQTSHLGPNGQLGSYIEFKLADINKAARREIDLVVWGWIEYDDVFPDTPRRRTEFSYKVEPRGKPENFQFGLLAIGPHNGADEDCYRKPKT